MPKTPPPAATTRRPGFIAIGLLFNTRAVQPAIAIAGPHFGLVQSGNIGRLPYLAGPIHLLFGESAYRRVSDRWSASGTDRLCHAFAAA
jgi:hypothetical protein